MTTVLIFGAGIAGPALANLLTRSGFRVTVVERAEALRTGGYPVDVRGPAVEALRRTGVLADATGAHVDLRRITFLDAGGEPFAEIDPLAMTGGTGGRDIEVPRGTLTALLHASTGTGVDYRFGESITALDDRGDDVRVTFASGAEEVFDLVVGADGLHSAVRRLAFGDEAPFLRPLGLCFAGFTVPTPDGMVREARMQNAPGRIAAIYTPDDSGLSHGFLVTAAEGPLATARSSTPEIVAAVRAAFAGTGGVVPDLLTALDRAEDVYADSVCQVRMADWSRGRVALVGDAAFGPSFPTGQGTSLALVGACVLAGELATRDDHAEAFAAYREVMREYVDLNHGLADDGAARLVPRTEEALEARNAALTTMGEGDLAPEQNRAINSLALPDYDRPARV
ncbi:MULTISPECIES: FAD-dependent monooxygenase [Actinosynnema]|uniref:FAD-dependent monooxygenase n=1 Tax=Actinosynnema TaxID=40566 RepID=UPI0020A4F171|nr:FAD-dependent monooxygenase [Actinosynnema pretiosum]MCP2094868.1 2-polyprenyl-6-methoxyphenol hydroxylase [Actinosynnema pretiosum]